MRSELEKHGVLFQYPKPKELINYILRVGSKENDIILNSLQEVEQLDKRFLKSIEKIKATEDLF